MKTYTEHELKEIAADVFRRYPKAKRVSCTSDGQAFITDESSADVKNHARENRYKEVLKIFDFNREECEKQEKKESGNLLPKVPVNPAKLKQKAKKNPLPKEKQNGEKNEQAAPAVIENEKPKTE